MNTNSVDFSGLRVAAFQSRKVSELTRLIEKQNGEAFVSPSMREASLDDQSAAVDFAHQLITGQVDVAVFLTGVGFRRLLEAVETRVDRQRYLDALSDIVTIARGPKPAVAMTEVGLKATHRVVEPNTWRELLQLVDAQLPVLNLRVGVQEYGKTNPSLIAGLEARGAHVINVPVYTWELPEDIKPLQANVRRLAAREIDVALFTSAHQLVNLLVVAEQLDLEDEVMAGLRRSVIASIGPTTSDALRHYDLPVDLEPEHPKMGQLVIAAAERSYGLLQQKKQVYTTMSSPESHTNDENAPWYNSPFMKACRREPTDVTPVWLMRQAGRYMAEYREVREKQTFLELCKNPSLCSEVMCTAVNRLGVDAAIIFSDLLPILEPMGLDLEFVKGDGPVIHNPIREAKDIDRVRELETTDELDFVMQTVTQTRADLPADMPLIGFAGAPFTLASYAIEGGASRNYLNSKSMMFGDSGAWRTLMEKFSRAITIYLNAQIAAGAQCVQIFDSWAGCLGVDDYRNHVLPYIKQIIAGLTPGTPVINFATGNPALLPLLAEAGPAVVGVDWRIRLDTAWETIGPNYAVQGNLDPCVLLTNPDEIKRRAGEVLDQAAGRPGHIFNLGHGVHQQTDVDNAIALVDAVHELSSR